MSRQRRGGDKEIKRGAKYYVKLDVRRLHKIDRRLGEDEPTVKALHADGRWDNDGRCVAIACRAFRRCLDGAGCDHHGRTAALVHGQVPLQLLGIAQHFGWHDRSAAADVALKNG